MTITSDDIKKATGGEVAHRIVDCDIHESFKSSKDLVPYLDTHWARYIEQYDWQQVPSALPYVVPTAGANTRLDWKVPGSPMGSDLGRMRRHLFDEAGVTTGILNGFCQVSTQEGSYELAAAIGAAYNDFQVAEWLEPEPRLRGSVHVVAHDPHGAAREIDRIGAHPQVVQVFLPAVTNREYGDPYYHPIYEAAVRNDLVVTLHHGGATRSALGYPRYFVEWHVTAITGAMMCQLSSLIFNGVFEKFPSLKVVVLESGYTWMPHFMWRADQQFRMLRVETPWVKRMPSEILRQHVRVATQPIEDLPKAEMLRVIDQMGSEEMLVFSTDYPHWDADQTTKALPAGLPEGLRKRIFSENAEATFPKLR